MTVDPEPPRVDGFDVHAGGLVRAPPAEVFGFLADLENHWLIADRFVDVLKLDGPPGARSGGQVRIRGPLGISRTATTIVDFARPDHEMGGSARIGSSTHAEVVWRLSQAADGTRVTLAARLARAGAYDRLLWALGGRAWMSHRFNATLSALSRRFGSADVPA